MKKVVFCSESNPCEEHVLAAHLGLDGELIFDDDLHFIQTGFEHDDRLTVSVRYKRELFRRLSKSFPGISNTCGEDDDSRLFWALDHVAKSGHWRSLGEIEHWLMERDIPFTKQIHEDKKEG